MAIAFRGVITPMVTPTAADGGIDNEAAQRLVEHLIRGGVHGIFLFGTTGEPYGFSLAQKRAFVQACKAQIAGRVPLYVGTGATTTREAVALTQMAEACGADAVSVVTPFFVTPSQEELYGYYTAVAASTSLPVILYNNLPRTGVTITAQTAARLAKRANIAGIKDSTGDFTLTNEYLRIGLEEAFHVFMGRDTLIHAGLLCGAAGAIAACSNVAPRLCADIYDKFARGDTAGSAAAQRALSPLRLSFGLGTFPEVIREGLRLVGVETGHSLAPVGPLSEDDKRRLARVIEQMGLQEVQG